MGKSKKSFKKFSRKGKVENAVKKRKEKRNTRQKYMAKTQKRLNQKKKNKAEAAAASASTEPAKEAFANDTGKIEPLGSMDSFLASFGADESDSGLEDASVGGDDAAAKEEEGEDTAEADIDEVEQHKRDLEILKQTDPDFYAYLQKSGRSLLEFDDPAPALGPGEESVDDSKLVEDLSTVTAHHHKGPPVFTLSMFQRFKTGALSGSLSSIKKLLKAFRAACMVNGDKKSKGDDPDAETDGGGQQAAYRITNSSVFSNLLVFCLGELPGVFAKILDYDPIAEEGERRACKVNECNIL